MIIEDIINESRNPYKICKLVIENTNEEQQSLIELNFESETPIYPFPYSFEFIEKDDNVTYIFARKDQIDAMLEILSVSKLKWHLSDFDYQIWQMSDAQLNDLLNLCDLEDESDLESVQDFEKKKTRIYNIIKTYCKKKYNIDDVLDKISKLGNASLNKVNKFILQIEQENL